MLSGSSGDGLGYGTHDMVVLPDGVRQIAKHYESVVNQSLKSESLSSDYISAFHVEPRGPSFLVGFRVGMTSGNEVFIYVEPNTRHRNSPEKELSETGGYPLMVWQFPSDPKLNSLASVVGTEPLGVLFKRLDLGWVPTEVELLAYRPGRRAVVRCSAGSSTAFVKAVRPQFAARVVGASRLARDAGLPAPEVIGWSPAGIVIYSTANGVELSRASENKISGETAINAALEALLMIEKIETEVPSRTPIIKNVAWYFARAKQAHPAERAILTNLEGKIRATKINRINPDNATTIHGDLHLGQIFVTNDSSNSVSGIIDLDDMGLGTVGDDIASLWSNCLASQHMNTADAANGFWRECLEVLASRDLPPATDAGRLHCSIATHLVAQTLSTRGLDPTVAHNLIKAAAAQLG
jgi:aminoglycoside phosphotransferase